MRGRIITTVLSDLIWRIFVKHVKVFLYSFYLYFMSLRQREWFYKYLITESVFDQE